MWPRQYDTATWNGIKFNLLQSDTQSGNKVQVSEIPYADEPYTNVLGSKAKKLNINAVFVGANSLGESLAFEEDLLANPVGILEHPEYGELELICDDVSQSIVSTKRGLVSLKVSFIRKGKPVSVLPIESKDLKNLTKPVIEASIDEFEKQVKAADVDEVSTIQNEMSGHIETLQNFIDQMSQSIGDVIQLQRSMNATTDLISSIGSSPRGFAESFTGVISSVSDQATSSNEQIVQLDEYGSGKFRTMMLSADSSLVQNAVLMGMLEMSRPVKELNATGNDIFLLIKSGFNLDSASGQLDRLQAYLSSQIDSATETASYDNMALADSLSEVQSDLSKKKESINTAKASTHIVTAFRPTNLLRLAKRYQTTPDAVASLNDIHNPMFVQGDVKVIPWLS